ncbi:hypothetical protein BS78_05G214200 [Paspalum vaginatum]|nr:hypothetical protein BS78_05G214200 [Paspalum vaginatum]
MATTPTSSPAPAAVVTGGGPATTTTQTIFGSHVLRIDNFSGTKDLAVVESIESSPFRVGGHAWYIRCYPNDKKSAGWVSLFLFLDHPAAKEQVEAKFTFTLIVDHVGDTGHEASVQESCTFSRENVSEGVDFIEREELESLLKDDDCFQLADKWLSSRFKTWDVSILVEEFRAVPRMDMEMDVVAAGLHVLTVDGYCKAFGADECIDSYPFSVGDEHSWFIKLFPCGEHLASDSVTAYLHRSRAFAEDEVKVQLEMSLLNLASEIIASCRTFYAFSATDDARRLTLIRKKYGGQVIASPC